MTFKERVEKLAKRLRSGTNREDNIDWVFSNLPQHVESDRIKKISAEIDTLEKFDKKSYGKIKKILNKHGA